MSILIVRGGTKLEGEICAQGSKNAALPILAASLLCGRTVRLTNVPRLSDVANMTAILCQLGCVIQQDGDALTIDSSRLTTCVLPERLSKEMRSSIFLLGSVLGRLKEAVATYPGGCEIGNRPIDLHLQGLKRLGAEIDEDGGRIRIKGGRLKGAVVQLDYPSVGATENVMLAACSAHGETVVQNAAREPEIVALQDFLNAAGYHVNGAGTSTVVIRGGGTPHELEYRIMPDRIAAGTLLTAGAISGGNVRVTGISPDMLSAVVDKLVATGCKVSSEPDSIALIAPERPKELERMDTLPYPGFPTDMQAQFFSLCQVADGTSVIVENVFENRFKHAQELRIMGGKNVIYGRTAVIRGVDKLFGAKVTARDLRGGAALVLAGLRAEGVTVVEQAEIIDRGYEALEEQLNSLGASIERKDN